MKKLFLFILLVWFCELCVCRRPRPIRPRPTNGSFDWILFAFIIVPNVGGWISYLIATLFSRTLRVSEWLKTLKVPRFYPPAWAIAVIWTLLYIGMGIAAYFVFLAYDGFTKDSTLPFTLYGIQLLLNWTWSPLYYGLNSQKFSFHHFIALDASAIACAISFFIVNKYTMCAMGPNLAFLFYLTIVSYNMWKAESRDKPLIVTVIDPLKY